MDQKILDELQQIKRLLGLNKQLFNVDDFCQYTGISKQYVYHLTSTGKIKFYRPSGKMIFFDKDDVIEFLKQNPINCSTKLNNQAIQYISKSN